MSFPTSPATFDNTKPVDRLEAVLTNLQTEVAALETQLIPGPLPWTPADASGAALSITVNEAQYARVGPLVTAFAQVVYPVTASGTASRLSGLPFTAQNVPANIFIGPLFGIAGTVLVNANTNTLSFFDPTGVAYTNANLSGKTLLFTALYRI